MDAKALIESLDAEQIQARLDELAGERQALMTLLRAARHRQIGLPDHATAGRQDSGKEATP